MADYYRTNAIYTELEKFDDNPYVWTSGNAWILLYANSAAEVKVIAVVLGNSIRHMPKKTILRIEAARSEALSLAKHSAATFACIEFDDESAEIKRVILNDHRTTLGELKDWFASEGLAVKGQTTSKAINDAASSAYHNWQRENLGAIKVTDLDLIQIDPKNGEVKAIFELKRSFISLEKWKPYQIDFQNFNVIENLVNRVGIHFFIAYNVRITKPTFLDDPSLISLFKYSRIDGAVAKGIISFENFRKGKMPK